MVKLCCWRYASRFVLCHPCAVVHAWTDHHLLAYSMAFAVWAELAVERLSWQCQIEGEERWNPLATLTLVIFLFDLTHLNSSLLSNLLPVSIVAKHRLQPSFQLFQSWLIVSVSRFASSPSRLGSRVSEPN